jgi:HlyD family secretion protein
LSRIPHVSAQRRELAVSLRATGQVESSVQTLIRCEVERIKGKLGNKPGSTTILSLVPEGSRVRAGDILCQLDASDYEELARLQRIVVAQIQAKQQRAQLDFEVAGMNLQRYLRGIQPVEIMGFQGQIALASAEISRLADRLEWSRRMWEKGYSSRAVVSSQADALERAEFDLALIRGQFQIFQKFEVITTIRSLESKVESAKVDLKFLTLRLGGEETRLAQLEKQIARCTIRAPHGGQVVFAHKPKRGLRIEEGLPVRQKQLLFYLPDPARLEVQVWLHETVLDQVRPGMRAFVRPEGYPRRLDGELSSIEFLPVMDSDEWSANDVKYYRGHVRLAEVPPDLPLGMSAEVEIVQSVRPAALVVPPQAVTGQDGRHVCYVLGPEGLVRRPISLGHATPDWLEVVAGLQEGEEVALPPAPTTTGMTISTTK